MPVHIPNIFVERKTSGVYRNRNPELLETLQTVAAQNDYKYVEIHGSEITNKQQFLESFTRETAAPMQFVDDWDYFVSELRHVEWITDPGIVIVYKDFQVFQQSDPEAFQILMDVVHRVIQEKSSIFSGGTIPLLFIFHSEFSINLPTVQTSTPFIVYSK